MITAQDIREKTFEKATFNGYAMSEVDDFLDELADNLVASQKEMLAMRSKMKVLVGKIEEYRSTEDAMHMALVTAQKTAQAIEDEAKAKADALLADAQAQADALLSAAQEESDRVTGHVRELREAEEARLAQAREAVSAYFAAMEDFTARESALLAELKDKDMIDEPAPEEIVEELPVEEEEEIVETAPAFEEPAFEEPAEEEPAFEEPSFDSFTFGEAPTEALPAVEMPAEEEPTVTPNDFLRQFEEAVYSQPEIGIPDAADGDEAPLFRF